MYWPLSMVQEFEKLVSMERQAGGHQRSQERKWFHSLLRPTRSTEHADGRRSRRHAPWTVGWSRQVWRRTGKERSGPGPRPLAEVKGQMVVWECLRMRKALWGVRVGDHLVLAMA